MLFDKPIKVFRLEADVMSKADTGKLTTAGHLTDPAFGNVPTLGGPIYIQEIAPFMVPVAIRGRLDLFPHGLPDSIQKGITQDFA